MLWRTIDQNTGALEREEEFRVKEADRMEAWIQDIKDSYQREKAYLLDHVAALRSKTHREPHGDPPSTCIQRRFNAYDLL